MNRRIIILAIFSLLTVAVSGLFAQDPGVVPTVTPAEEFEALLATNAVTYAQACRFALDTAEVLITQDPDEAFRFAAEKNWLPKKASPGDQARLDGISLLLLNAFDIKGGLFYKMTGSAHYAYRELSYRNMISGRADPTMKVSGELFIFIINKILAEQEKLGNDI